MKKLLSIISALILVLSVLLCACTSKPQNSEGVNENENGTTNIITDGTTDDIKTDSTTEKISAEDEKETTTQKSEEAEETATAKPKETKPYKVNTEKEQLSVSEIVSLYNTSANRIKKEAKTIIRNYKKSKSVDKYLSLPSAISGIGKWAMNTFVKGTDEAHIWTSKEDFKIGFPVGNTDYTSHLTEGMVKSAKCTETANAYKIEIILKDDAITSPKKGQGYAGVFNTVTASTFEDINVPGVSFETVKVNGINGKISCTIDKSSKTVTEIVFWNTDVLDLGVKVAGNNLNAKFALSSEESFTIKY